KDADRSFGDAEPGNQDLTRRSGVVLTDNKELVFGGEQFRVSFGGPVQGVVNIFLDKLVFVGLAAKRLSQRRVEGFKIGKDDEAVQRIDGNAFHEVEVSVALRVVHLVETVKSENFDQLTLPECLTAFLQLRIINPRTVVAVDHPQLKSLPRQLVHVKGVDVLHHQIPGRDNAIARIPDRNLPWAKEFQEYHFF